MFLYLLAATAILALVNPLFAIPALALLLYLYPLASFGVLAVLAVWKWRGAEISRHAIKRINNWRERL